MQISHFLAVFAVRDQQSVTLDECYCKFLFWSQLRLSWDEINFFLIIPWEDQPELSFEHFFSLKFDWFSLYLTVYVILSLAAQFNDTFSAMTEIKIWYIALFFCLFSPLCRNKDLFLFPYIVSFWGWKTEFWINDWTCSNFPCFDLFCTQNGLRRQKNWGFKNPSSWIQKSKWKIRQKFCETWRHG